MIQAIAIDDEPLALEILEGYCADQNVINLVKTFTQTSEARKYLDEHPVELLFLDIHMPAMSGIDFYKDMVHDTMVIFTTAHSQYAVDGFNLSAIDFLLKPYSQERFLSAINRAAEFHDYLNSKPQTSNHIFIRSEYNLLKIATADILYIEGLADYLRIHLRNARPVLARMTMKAILERLPQDFRRVHRSYIIPMSRIESVNEKVITLSGIQIPIGSSYIEGFEREWGL